MPLYIRDDTVDTLAEQVMKLTGAKTKTDAVRAALQAQINAVKAEKPLMEKIREAHAMADEIGPVDGDFDMKTFTDDMWDER